MEAVQERKGRTRNMTTGDPVSLILGFAIPMLFGTLFQQFYSMADTIIVGRFLGVDALAGVGSTAAVNFMVNGFVIGTCSGFSVPVSQRFGAGDYKDMRKFIGSLIWLTAVIAVLLTALAALMTRRILVFMSTPDNIIDYAYRYIFIIFLGIPATYLYNSTACVIRALGDSKTPVLFLVLTSLINIVLDYVSIVFLGFSVDGPALATVAAQAFSGILCVFYMKKKFPVLRFEAREMQPDGRKCAVLLGMGLPMGLQYSVTAIGSVILQTAVNSLGSAAVASITAGQKIHMFCCCVFDALGGTMATYAGQNTGAGKPERIRAGVFAATKIGSIYALFICGVLVVFGDKIPLLFLDAAETEVIRGAKLFLTMTSLFYIPLAIVNIWRFTIQGMGYSGLAVLAGVCEMTARALVGFAGVPRFGYTAACFASPLAWLMADAFLIPAFFFCLRRFSALVSKQREVAAPRKRAVTRPALSAAKGV